MTRRLALCLIALAPAAAHAQTTSDTRGSAVATTGPMEIGGAEPVRCAVVTDRESAPINLLDQSSLAVQISVDCNSRFRITARSDNGDLRLKAGYLASDARTYVPYSIAWPTSLLDSRGTPIGTNFSATGDVWARGLTATSAPTRRAQTGSLVISWTTPPNVAAGDYGDVLYFNIEPN